jgi:hypothetical protein
MHWGYRLIVAGLVGVLAAATGFGGVVLLFLIAGLDTGIGGGLVALLVGLICAVIAALKTFIRLSGKSRKV